MSVRLSVSTVTPVYSGAAYLRALVEKLNDIRNQWTGLDLPFELVESIFVNDDAIDASDEVLAALASEFDWVKVITNSKNFGQHPATIAGILHCSGDWIVTLDEDLQHDPAFIEKLLKNAFLNRSDIVYARPEAPVHGAKLRDFGSVAIKNGLSLLTRNKNIPLFNSFRLIRGTVARAAACVCSHETYFDIALSWFTNRVGAVHLPMRDPRFIQTGKSGYNLFKLLAHARRMVISSQTKILRVVALIGFFVIVADITCGSLLFVFTLWHRDATEARGWASLFLATLFFGGLTLLMSSIILEYLTGVVLHIQGKPTFFIIDRSSDALAVKFYQKLS
jgi:glycosyltransferase involved in cell wall biosynthesis